MWGLILLALAVAAPLAHPRVRSALHWTPGFTPLPEDGRVWAEPGAEEPARILAGALDEAVARVESGHGAPFVSPFRLFVCATEESFARRLGLDPAAPVRGMALWRDVWISPRAFHFAGRDTSVQSVVHELSHLHLNQHLGLWAHRRRIPTWLGEGLADRVADTGFEIVAPEEARQALQEGRRVVPTGAGSGLLGGDGFGDGIPWPLGHAQARLFLAHLERRDGVAYRQALAAILAGDRVDEAMGRAYGTDLAGLWSGFLAAVAGSPAPGPGESE